MEIRNAIQKLSSGKATGADAIPAEVYKAGVGWGWGLPLAEKLYVEEGGYPTRI